MLANALRRLVATIPLLLIAFVGATQATDPRLLQREGAYRLLPLPPGSTELLLSQDGRWVLVGAVTFNSERDTPERIIAVVDLVASRVVWWQALSSRTCCAFPVLAVTPDGEAIAVGGGEETLLYARSGSRVFAVPLGDGRLHSSLGIADDGRLLVVGEWEGRLASFRRGQTKPLWVRDTGPDLMAVALAGDGEVVAAALRDEWLLLRATDGALITRRAYGPARYATVAISRNGARVALVWKRADERMVVEFLERGQTVWTQILDKGTVPLLQMDAGGQWLAVGDLLGLQAALLSSKGELMWRSGGAGRAAVAVAPDGSRAAIAQGSAIEVRDLPSGQTIWRNRLPGVAHLLRVAGRRLAVVGALQNEGLPDRVWFVEIARFR